MRYLPENCLKIDIESKMTKQVANILLSMARYIGGKLVVNGTDELESTEQLK